MAEISVVTGGCGFIGSNIARALVQKGHKVVIIDNLFTGKLENIRDIKRKVKFYKADIRNFSVMKKVLKHAHNVFHEAALRSVFQSIKQPQLYAEVNINGIVNLLEAAKLNNVENFIFASSSSVYGNTGNVAATESLHLNPTSPYAISKATGEHFCKFYHDNFGLRTVALRYFNVFGERQDAYSEYANVIPKFVALLMKNKKPEIYGDGEQRRDFTYIQNVVEANLACLDAHSEAYGEAVNIGNGKHVSVNELYKKISDLLGKHIVPNHTPPKTGDDRFRYADVSKARHLLKWQPAISFDEGLKKTVDWFKQKGV